VKQSIILCCDLRVVNRNVLFDFENGEHCTPDSPSCALPERISIWAAATFYILCREDRTLCSDWWREWVRKQLGIIQIELGGGHCPHVSRPGELAGVLAGLPY